MNDNASLALGQRSGLGGLPQRLVQDGVVEEAAMLTALQAAKDRKSSFVTQLIAAGAAKARDIAVAASAEFGVPLYDLDSHNVDLDTVKLVQDKLLQKHRCLPLYRRGKRLFLGVADPTNLHAIDEIKFQTGMGIEAVVVEDDKLQKCIDKAVEQADSAMPQLAEDETGFDLENLDVSGGDDDMEGAGVTRDDIEDAPILKEVAQPPVQLAMKLSARLKVMSRLDIAERRVPQDGRIKMKLSKTRAIDFRVSTCPTLFGEKIVCRILDPSQAMLGIDSLGYEPFQRELYLKNLAKPQGMILVTGPTGSGKTVSLYTGLNILNREDTNISTAEDPAEINLPGVNQVNVNNKVGLTFAAALRAFLRQDPDVVMVGEIRDLETAEIAIKAAQTGHLVMSTLHTNDAPQTLTRLVDMGVKPYAIATSVSLIIAQRLARRLCPQCKVVVDVPAEALLKEGFLEADVRAGIKIMGAKGCSACTDGYKGRVGIYQVMPVTEALGRIIMEGGNAIDIADQAAKEGVWDLRRAGLEKVKQGMTSIEEVNSVTIE
jgi:type IV pilus assembly protein PilB